MKIPNVEAFMADGEWRPWILGKIETDGGNRLRVVHRSWVAITVARLGKPDIPVNNAGIARPGTVQETRSDLRES